ncbi:hypothetical protein CsSME_00001477 [Camellia sinensis var. sinensis]
MKFKKKKKRRCKCAGLEKTVRERKRESSRRKEEEEKKGVLKNTKIQVKNCEKIILRSCATVRLICLWSYV